MQVFRSVRNRCHCHKAICGYICNRNISYGLCVILVSALLLFIPIQGGANLQVVGIEQDNTTVNVKVNEVLRIELPGNAGTGFQWRFDELDEVYFILMDSDTKIPEKTNPNFVGNSYQKSWRIKAVRSGSSAIRLLYYRSWEGKDMAEKEFNIKVVVKPE